jgi:hypothetical protein
MPDAGRHVMAAHWLAPGTADHSRGILDLGETELFALHPLMTAEEIKRGCLDFL